MAWNHWSSGQDIGRPFQGSVWFYSEYGYGSGATEISQCYGSLGGVQLNMCSACSVSPVVEVCRIETGDVNRYYRGLDNIFISKATKTNVDHSMHLEYLVATDDRLLPFLVNRSSATVRSLIFVVKTAKDQTDVGPTWVLTGCKCRNAELAGSTGEAWKVSADFSVASVIERSSTWGSRPTAGLRTTGDICMFNVGGSLTNPDANTFAYITNSFSCSINHNLQDLYTIGQRTKENVIESAYDITGTMDISLDGGGKYHFRDVLAAAAESTVSVFTSRTDGSPLLNLYNVRFNSSSIDVSPGNEGMMESAPWTAQAVSCTTLNHGVNHFDGAISTVVSAFV